VQILHSGDFGPLFSKCFHTSDRIRLELLSSSAAIVNFALQCNTRLPNALAHSNYLIIRVWDFPFERSTIRTNLQMLGHSFIPWYILVKRGSVEQGLGSKVVLSLREDLKNSFRHIYFGNFFCSAGLLIDLFRAGLYGYGTTRINRKGFPPELKKHTKKGFKERGESKTYQHGNLTASVWQDAKPVVIMATNSNPTAPTTVERKQRDGSKVTYPCPTSVSMYNTYVGVWITMINSGYYHVRLKCRKYKYIMWFLFDVAITNIYVLCKLHTDLKYTNSKDFHVDLAKELIGNYFGRKRPGRPPSQPAKKCLSGTLPHKRSKTTSLPLLLQV